MESVNVLVSDNKIIFDHIKKYVKNFNLALLHEIELLSNFKKIDLLIIDSFDLKINSYGGLHQEVTNRVDDILSKIYINNIVNLSSLKIKNCFNFEKPFLLNSLLTYIEEKNKCSSLFICLNNYFLYDEMASKIEHDSKRIKLTFKENKILKFILESDGYKSNKPELSVKIWGHNENVDSSTVEFHMYKLKNKLPHNFLNIQGFSYFLNILSIC